MPPQTPSPNPQYDFIMNNGQPAKKGFKLPMPKLPKPVLYIMGATVGLIVLIIAISVISGSGKSANSDYVSAVARAQEISRVSTEVAQLSKDTNTKNLASTTATTLTSAQSQLTDYLTGIKVKISTAGLTVYMSKSTDTQMEAAASNGDLASTYASYLKTQLGLYQSSLQAAYKSAGPKGKAVLNEANNSAKTILNSAQISSS